MVVPVRSTRKPDPEFQPVYVEVYRHRDFGAVPGEATQEADVRLDHNPVDLSAEVRVRVGDMVIAVEVDTGGTIHLAAHRANREEPEHYDAGRLGLGETLLRWSHRAAPLEEVTS